MSKDYENVHNWLTFIETDLSDEKIADFKKNAILGIPMVYDYFTDEYNKNYPKLLELRKRNIFSEVDLKEINKLKKEIDDAHNQWLKTHPQK
jgi:hypothetical protein